MKAVKFLFILALLCILAGCREDPQPTAPPVESTGDTVAASHPVPTAEPSKATEDTSPYPAVKTPRNFMPADVDFFDSLLGPSYLDEAAGKINYYNRILQSEFQLPQAADLSCIFREQDTEEAYPLTKAEKDFLITNGIAAFDQVQRISVPKMDTVLYQLLGLRLSQMSGVGLEGMVYCPETDCYYLIDADTVTPELHILGGKWKNSKTAEIYYILNGESYTATLEKTGSNFRFLSIVQMPHGTAFPEDAIVAPLPTLPQQTEPLLELAPSLWLVEQEYPCYEEYFSSEHSLSQSSDSGWLVSNGGKGIRYWLDSTDLTVHSSVREDVFRIPDGDQWKDYGLIHADGQCAWLINDTQIVMLQMDTGEILRQVQISCGSRLDGVLTDNTVYYFADHSDGQFHIYRVYLPELKMDCLQSFAAPETFLRLRENASIHKEHSLVWTAVSPQILTALEEANQDPNCALRFEGCGNLWESQYPYADVQPEYLKYGIYCIQNALKEPAYVHYIYNYAEGTFTTQSGIICGCEYGTGLPHDHGEPVEYEIAQPIPVKEAWLPIPGLNLQEQLPEALEPREPEAYRFLSFVNMPDNLPYLVEDGIYTQLHTEGAKSSYTFPVHRDEGQGIYYISEDNRLLQLSYDGSICNTLYVSSGVLTDAAYLDGYFYILEEDKILQLDPQSGKYRVLIYQKDCKMLEAVSMPEGQFLYIRAAKGLSFTHYVYDPAKDRIEPWNAAAI